MLLCCHPVTGSGRITFLLTGSTGIKTLLQEDSEKQKLHNVCHFKFLPIVLLQFESSLFFSVCILRWKYSFKVNLEPLSKHIIVSSVHEVVQSCAAKLWGSMFHHPRMCYKCSWWRNIQTTNFSSQLHKGTPSFQVDLSLLFLLSKPDILIKFTVGLLCLLYVQRLIRFFFPAIVFWSKDKTCQSLVRILKSHNTFIVCRWIIVAAFCTTRTEALAVNGFLLSVKGG